MKTIKFNSKLKLIVTSFAISLSSISLQSANAQSFNSELPEIGWKSRLSSMGLNKPENVGKIYDFYCQPAAKKLAHAPIWGTSTYTVNSGICSAAVHSGMIAESGGVISVELREGKEFYTGTIQNEITSKDHIGTKLSFDFRGEAMAVRNQQYYSNNQPNNQQRRPSNIERVMVNSVQRGLERSIEKAITDIFN